MIKLSKEQVLKLHSDLIQSTGGLDGIRDMNLLDSALDSAYQIFNGMDLFPSIYQKAARLGFGIISNHPFVDGNKRTGTHVMLVLLALNGIDGNSGRFEPPSRQNRARRAELLSHPARRN